MLAQPWSQVAADTKLDLVLNPAGFLAQALNAYAYDMPLGQLQNQAYGYLFPQGTFFLLTSPLPDWWAQRLWWTIVTGVGFSGLFHLARRAEVPGVMAPWLAAMLFALSPRTLTTLTAISSETWPVMLSPWVVAAVLSARLDRRALAAAVLPVAAMGAVNATATLLACLPAGVVLAWRMLAAPRRVAGFAAAWLAGCALVSLWWIGPLLVLGRYSPPFTDFIESAAVTTRWLNLAEIIRGATSWAPFVDTERTAGALLAVHPIFILATMALAAVGLAGLTLPGVAHRDAWVLMLLTGVVLLGAAQGPVAAPWLGLLDGPLAAFRNLHKADPLVRIPLMIGVGHLASRLRLPRTRDELTRPTARMCGAALVGLCALAVTAPATSARLLPTGTWDQVPDYWYEATDYLNEVAADTRTLVVPEASFARLHWGWTRDEPAQPLLDVPWAVRDAVPLVDPEAIRGLDGAMAALRAQPERADVALRSLGIGALLVREDIDRDATNVGEPLDVAALPGTHRSFGPEDELTVVLFDASAPDTVTTRPVRVAGGGESVALLDALTGYAPRELIDADADVVTDTPLAVSRNYGTVAGGVSAPLAEGEGADVRNRVRDYPSAGARVAVAERGGELSASSSAADATSFGGADPARSVTAAVDGSQDTAWWPTPGRGEGEWLELRAAVPSQARLSLLGTDPVEVIVSTGPLGEDTPGTRVRLNPDKPVEVIVPGPATGVLRVTLTNDGAVGIREFDVAGVDVQRVVTVPDTSPDASMFFFQRLMVDTKVLIRDFTAPREMTVRVSLGGAESLKLDGESFTDGEELTLSPGRHRLSTDATWVVLTAPEYAGVAARPLGGGTSLALPGVSFNAGLRGYVDGTEVPPVRLGPGMQAFALPAGVSGPVTLAFAGERAYSISLIAGLSSLLLSVGVCLWWTTVHRNRRRTPIPREHPVLRAAAATVALGVVAGVPGIAAVAAAWAVGRFTLYRPAPLIGAVVAIAGAWLARSPWPTASYAGDDAALAWLMAAAVAVAALSMPTASALSSRRVGSRRSTSHRARRRTTRAPGFSTSS
ncbi:putative DUF3367 family protein [Corynebacterium uterequi]|uniref:Putative DUF3367 family protein n=1 Tax=Corynebacterium uterequi TaxID=1072256 RepID=A0A0G3HJ95_9CORY|nr:putative DUF3367 family protein [Corynebacterium uterequi]